MKSISPRSIELLAPARNLETAIAAIDHGADAIYIGGPSHGARASAGNSVDDIKRIVEYAHPFNVKVYVTLNTLVYDNEISEVEKLIRQLYIIGVDALIVQDMSLLRMKIPPIALHASTQCDTRTPQKASMLEKAGFSQIVLARELTFQEISDISKQVSAPLEVFVHGALCVSFSGDCRASFVSKGRSANRGECAQICRLPFNLVDEKNNIILKDKHLLSLKDMNRITYLQQLLDAGASSFKIEGRLKDVSYVKTVVAAYRQALDSIIERSPDKFCRSSRGRIEFKFTPDINKTFNRGFTPYFLDSRNPANIASLNTPKSIGIELCKVIKTGTNHIEINSAVQISNGDGLGFFDKTGKFTGFRVNRVEHKKLYVRTGTYLPSPGTVLYRNRNREFDKAIETKTSQRKIPVDFVLRRGAKDILVLDGKISGENIEVSVSTSFSQQLANTNQIEIRQKNLAKLGATVFYLNNFTDTLSETEFISASVLSELRRNAIDALLTTLSSTYHRELRKKEDCEFRTSETISSRHNVANRLAAQFYEDHGSKEIFMARETESGSKISTEEQVMECRHCIRRELGACLKSANGKKLPSKLYLTQSASNERYRLDFDCKNCLMRVFYVH